jgi:Septum formation
VSDGKDEDDGSDWLANQFGATADVPTHVPPTPTAPPPPTVPMPPAPAAPPPAAPPPAAAPALNTGGGFNWGLKPGAAAEPTPPPLVLPPTEPYVPPTGPSASEPTQPLSWDEFAATQQQPAPAAPAPVDQPTEAYTVQPWQPAAVTSPSAPAQNPTDPTSAIDSLFGEHKFQDYEEVGVLGAIQVPAAAEVADEPVAREPREPLPKTQKVLLAVAAGLLAALILVGLFFLGQHLGSAASAQPVTRSTGASSATPTPAGTGGPAAPGARQWTALQGGECIQPFSSAWALTFTVVACTADHDAEMVFKGSLPDTSDAKYPSAAEFQKEITPLCSAPTAINYGAAASVTDLQVSFSYPPNSADWQKGDRTYYCFVNRVSGGNLPGDLAIAKAP